MRAGPTEHNQSDSLSSCRQSQLTEHWQHHSSDDAGVQNLQEHLAAGPQQVGSLAGGNSKSEVSRSASQQGTAK